MERKSYTSSQVKNCFQRLSQLEKIIFEISNTSLEDSVQTVFDLLESDYPYSSNLLICKFIYASFVSQKRFLNRYFRFMKLIDIKVNKKIFSLFANFLDRENSQEAFYILEILNEKKLIEPYYVERNASLFFVHHMSLREIKNAIEFNRSMFCTRFKENIEELSKNDWELHKKYVKEGHNPNEIAKIIRNDKIEKLQEISSQTNFDFNQTIEPSLYERCSFINQRKVTLIDYAAFFSSVKCFKYLLMNGCNIEDTLKYAIAGGNLEIIHLCEQNHSSYKGAYEAAIEFHRNDIVKYYYDNKIIEINDLKELGIECIYYHNYIIFSFLIDEGMKITNFNMELSGISNIFLIELFYDEKQIQKDSLISFSDKGNIELVEYLLHKGFDVNAKNVERETALLKASKNNNTEIIRLLLDQKEINVNIKDRYGRTALINTIEYNQIEIVKLLLNKGINVNAKNKVNGKTALMTACEKGYTEIVKLLLKQEGININATNEDGQTSLMIASYFNHIEIVQLLLKQNGIRINTKDEKGDTALILASRKGCLGIVELLLEQDNIDFKTKNNFGEAAISNALRNGHIEIIFLLLEAYFFPR